MPDRVLNDSELKLLEILVRKLYCSHWTFDELSDEANEIDTAIRKLLDIEDIV